MFLYQGHGAIISKNNSWSWNLFSILLDGQLIHIFLNSYLKESVEYLKESVYKVINYKKTHFFSEKCLIHKSFNTFNQEAPFNTLPNRIWRE